VTDAVTQISTAPVQFAHAVTDEVPTVGHHKELRELTTKTKSATIGSARARECPVSERVSPSGQHSLTDLGLCVNCGISLRQKVLA
jgi:hypothetical protein